MALHIGEKPYSKINFLDGHGVQEGFQESRHIDPILDFPTEKPSIDGFSTGVDCNKIDEKPRKSGGRRKSKNWQIAGPEIIGRAMTCPNAIVEYATMRKNNHDPIVDDIRKHLAYLGWKIEYVVEKHDGATRFRYTSPDGCKPYFSLVQICQDLKESMENSEDANVYTLVKGISSDDVLVVEPENCPEAVEYWNLHELDREHRESDGVKASDMKLKARKHLAFLKWVCWYADKGGGKRELRYTSPSGVTYYSLRTACQGCIDEGLIKDAKQTASKLSGTPQSKERKRKCNLVAAENTSKKLRDDPKCKQPVHVLRSGNRPIRNVNFDKDLVRSQVVLPPENPLKGDVVIIDEGHDNNLIKPDTDGCTSPLTSEEESSSTGSNKIDQNPQSNAAANWQLAGPKIIGRGEYYPNAIVKYARTGKYQHVEDIRKHLSCLGWKIEYGKAKGINGKFYLRFRYTSPGGRCYLSLLKLCQDLCNSKMEILPPISSRGTNAELQESLVPSNAEESLQSKKRRIENDPPADENDRIERQEALPRTPSHTNRTVLARLIDQKVVSPSDKVHYRGRNPGQTLKTGTITREGIKCNCCDKLFNLTGFEAHAGSNLHRPAANIFLEDGRSLMDCQFQVSSECNGRSSKTKRDLRMMKGNRHKDESDYICSVCHIGGDLILCDQCPSCFHQNCLRLQDVPEGNWFCPSCCCAICQQIELTEGSVQSSDNSFLTCEQCEQKYHPGCLKSGAENLESCHQDKWFCSSQCEMVHSGLHELLGRPVPVSDNNLSWTLLKSTGSGVDAENYKKLNAALGVMHECFEPCEEGYTGRDLVEDVIFSRGSKLRRLNFKGFYTVVLQKNEELVSVANVRLYGNKVAEVPLVATRFKFRGQGMCRILMNKLEEKLKELGVERIVLPAISSTLKAWTTSFGFSEMTDSERAQFLNYTFLVFPDIIMCQKNLVTK